MKSIDELLVLLDTGGFNGIFTKLYGSSAIEKQKDRYRKLLFEYKAAYPGHAERVKIVSAPGRAEVGGNHTDHNGGHVLAAAVNLDVIAAASATDENTVSISSEGYEPFEFALEDHKPCKAEYSTAVSLAKGIVARFGQLGFSTGGIKCLLSSDVLKGSGLSSSAAFEVCVASVFNHLFNNGGINPVTIAQIARYSENVFFNKPCGLMDMTVSSVGGFVSIDFNDFANPAVKKIDFDFNSVKHALCVVDTGGNHADLTNEYRSIETEMKTVANLLGADVLAHTNKNELTSRIDRLRKEAGDRAVLRALHFFNDDMRVIDQTAALGNGDFELFKKLVVESGYSSFMYNQNIYSDSGGQGLSVALAISSEILKDRGAWRVHGGGFAGTIQAFVPNDLIDEYRKAMTSIFGKESFYELTIRPEGAIAL